MFKIALLIAVAGLVYAQTNYIQDRTNGQGPYVWDLLPPPLSPEEIGNLLASAQPGTDFPIYNEVPDTGFDCNSVTYTGFYADVDAGCQVIRRCSDAGEERVMNSWLCPNGTLFQQTTFVCDWYFNVDCPNSRNYYDTYNQYVDQQDAALHDTPPEGYLPQYVLDAIARAEEEQPSK